MPTEPVEPAARSRRPGRIAAWLVAACGVAAAGWYANTASHGAITARWVPPSRSAPPAQVAALPAGADPAAAPPAAPVADGDAPAIATRDVQTAAPAEPAPAAIPIKRRRHDREPRERAARPAVRVEPVAAEPPAPPAPVAPVPQPAAAPRTLHARIDGVDVTGSLPARAVQRAIERRWSAIQRCVPGSPETVVARFTIGEARRARDVRAAGPTAETNACVVAAITDVRTEAAPDVGDVEVTVRIAFVVST